MRANFDSLKFAVEGLSGGKNTVIFDDRDMPSIMVKIPKMKNAQLISGGDQEYHDAFKLDTAVYDCLYIGKYLATVVNDRAYSLPGKDPRTSVNFNKAREYCRNKGAGWHLPTNALYAAIALWCKQNKTQPHGNTQWGKDYAATFETGAPTTLDTGNTDHKTDPAHTATGSGPDSWYHDFNAATGIADLCGNVWEWASGLRLKDGQIQIIPYGDAMKDTLTGDQDIMGENSSKWKAIASNGDIVETSAADTLKYDYKTECGDDAQGITMKKGTLSHKQSTESHYAYSKFNAVEKEEGISAMPKRAILLGLYPENAEDTAYDKRGGLWIRNMGERLPIRGGGWYNGTNAGVFALNLSDLRSYANGDIGFRVAFYGNL